MNSPIRHPLANALQRHLSRMFGGAYYDRGVKRSHYSDFGYPDAVTFSDYYAMYSRNGIASALVDKTTAKTWETTPWLMEFQPEKRPTETNERGREVRIGETQLEAQIRRKFQSIRFWQCVKEADRMSLVGEYSALILRYRDGERMDQPVTGVPGGLDGLHEVLPVWQGQLRVATWHDDPQSLEYGNPKMFEFNEASIPSGESQRKTRSFSVHPDRVVIFSSDGSTTGKAALEPSYNALLDLEKIVGAGGEGFYKNASQRLALEAQGDDNALERLAQDYNNDPNQVLDAINEQMADFKAGFDKAWLMQGFKLVPIAVSMGDPEKPYNIALQVAAAPFGIPTKELVGNQTGERASTEDATEWAKANMARREDRVLPAIYSVVNRLEAHGILPPRDWYVDWASLIDATPDQQLERAERMVKANQGNALFGQVFAVSEIREEAGREPDMPEDVLDDGFDENDDGDD
jgi:hypothetical protein